VIIKKFNFLKEIGVMNKIHGLLMSAGCAAAVILCTNFASAQDTSAQSLPGHTGVIDKPLSVGTTSGTLAQKTPKPQPQTPEEFAKMAIQENDKNGDGKIGKDEFKGTEEAFKAVDTNGDGFVTEEELTVYMKKMMEERQKAMEAQQKAAAEKIEQQAQKVIEKADTNKDGKMSYDEFVESNKTRFKELDTNGDGFVTLDELIGDTTKKVGMGMGASKMNGAVNQPGPVVTQPTR
jgi:Ca2+-binding EF-hand superfamily protein